MADSSVIHDRLESARRDLLDLTTRNRLLSTSRSSTRSGRLEIVDELSDEVFRILVQDKKSMSFLAGASSSEAQESGLLFQPDEDVDVDGVAARGQYLACPLGR